MKMDHNVTKIHEIVSNIDTTVMKIQEGANSQNLSVSITRTMFVTEQTLTVA